MENTIKQAVNKIIGKRVEDAAYLKVKESYPYTEVEKRIDEGFEKLKTSFTAENQKKLLLELEDAWNLQQALRLEYAYRQGLEDSMVLQDMLKTYEHLVKRT